MRLQEFTIMAEATIPQEKSIYLAYGRKSEESEDKQVQSIPDQIKILTEEATRRGIQIEKIFTESKSAKAPGRAEFNAMMQLIQTRKDIKGIFCWKLNRLFRNPIDEGQVRWLLQSKQIEEVITPFKTYLEADADFTMAVEGAQSQRFISDLTKDSARGVNSKIEKGHAPILAPPGYVNDTHKRQGERTISPHKIYFPLMKQLFALFMTGNYSVTALCNKADELGIRNSRGKPISKSQMYIVLLNPFYCGKFIYGKKLHQGAHKPMITEVEFDLIQDILQGNAKPRKFAHDIPLTGLIKCGQCNMMITAETHTKKYKNGTSQTFTYYRCSKKGKYGCTERFLAEDKLEEQVTEYLSHLELPTKFLDWSIKWLNVMNQGQRKEREAKKKAIKIAYEAVLKRIDNLLDLKLDPENIDGSLISNEEFADKKRLLLIEKKKVANAFNLMDKDVDDWTDFAADTFDLAKRAMEKFNKGGSEEKKLILFTIGSNLILKDKQLAITMRTPFFIAKKMKEKFEKEKWLVPNFQGQIGEFSLENETWGE